MRRGVLLLIPFLFLALLEMGLRLLEYGGNLDLVVTRRVGNRDVYSINRSAAARYFSTAGTVIPEPADDVFEMVKSDSTIRIFCLGESTMAGFPYDFNATAPGFLRDRLQMRFPGRKIEIRKGRRQPQAAKASSPSAKRKPMTTSSATR